MSEPERRLSCAVNYSLPAADLSPPEHQPWQLRLAGALLLLALFTTTTLGAIWSVATHTDDTTDLGMWIGAESIRTVWTDPGMLVAGLSFSIPLLLILLCHELGHYLPCRWYRLPTTPPRGAGRTRVDRNSATCEACSTVGDTEVAIGCRDAV